MGGSGGSSSHGSAGRRTEESSGGGGGGGGGRGGGGISCEDLEVDALLRALKAAAKKLKVGDELTIRIGKDGTSIEVVNSAGEVVGSIVVPEQAMLIECMEAGTLYKGKVKSIKGESIVIHVSAKKGK